MERYRAVPKGGTITHQVRHGLSAGIAGHDLAPGLARQLHTNLTICHFFSSQLKGIMWTNDSIKCLFHFPLLFFVAEYPVPGTGYFVVFWTFYRLPDKLEFDAQLKRTGG